ncbi:MAG: shikimate kinase [Chloroherpetonaceae bacterium]|nr:shikimate kinase [Chloroherpetonaceae bacterium]MDW8020300.1 shikimate kinase [Chloroherpetonaceae bacterium]
MQKKPNLIFLTGFSTAGKSTIGPILANSLGYDFVDIDKAIVEKEKKSVVEIFREKGEAYFRQLEYELLQRYAQAENLVVALGGGTLENDKSFDIVKESGTIIYLKSEIETLTKRLANKDDRPLMKAENGERLSPEELRRRVEQLLLNREDRYQSHSVISISTDQYPIGKTVELLTRQIERYLKEQARLAEE